MKKLLKGVGIGLGVLVACGILIDALGSDSNTAEKENAFQAAKELAAESTTEVEEVVETEEPTEVVVETEEPIVETEEVDEDQPWLQDSGDADASTDTIDYIEAFDPNGDYGLQVTNHGDRSIEDITSDAEYVTSGAVGYSTYTDDFVRNLSNVGMAVEYSGTVMNASGNYVHCSTTGTDHTVIDLSYVNANDSVVLFGQDNVSVSGVYLGLNSRNYPVILAIYIN